MQRTLFSKPNKERNKNTTKVKQKKLFDTKPNKENTTVKTQFRRAYAQYYGWNNKEAKIYELIQQRRLQLLVHSRIYYVLNNNIISDKQFDDFAKELVQLQKDYPQISKDVIFYNAFKNWDGTTGFDLPLEDSWVVQKANQLLRRN